MVLVCVMNVDINVRSYLVASSAHMSSIDLWEIRILHHHITMLWSHF